MELIADADTKKYYNSIEKKSMEQFEIAVEAKKVGKDVSLEVECPPTLDLADRTENIIGPKGIAKRYREVYAEFKGNRTKAIFQLFKEIIEGDLGEIPDPEKRLEQAVKTALVLVTEGVVVAPLDGVPKVKISKNSDGSKYVDIYFAGPIRAAGGTATVFPLILGDYAKQLMNLGVYRPTKDEVERYVEEINIYDEIITRQYKLKDDDVRKIIRGCPVCINGEPTEDREVTSFKDLKRIPSNKIRGGMCLVISEGIGLKAMKIMSLSKMLGLDWSWLEDVIKLNKGSGKEKEIKPNFNYISRIAAGRPIFSYPSKWGGFRLRYGRARNTCIMAKGIHPATMYLLDEFIAVGTQTKVERPGKSAEMFPVDTIEGPIVKLDNEEVRRITSAKEALEIRDRVKELLYLGDILVAVGDFRKTAHPLIPVGYCEEWWKLELEKVSKEKSIAGSAGFDIQSILAEPSLVDQNTALELSMQLGIPLHPKYIHYYNALSKEEAIELVKKVRACEKTFNGNEIEELLLDKGAKELLEKIGVPHALRDEKAVVGTDYAYSFYKSMGGMNSDELQGENACEIFSSASGLTIKDKGGSFIGLRMGRPEAARPRKMVGDPMTLFPLGFTGGNTRSINKAIDAQGLIEGDIAYFLNTQTNNIEEQAYSNETHTRNELVRKCIKCEKYSKSEKCPHCFADTNAFSKRKIDLAKLMKNAATSLGYTVPPLVKGVKGLINAEKIPEPVEKGILRARHNLHIFRDGTIRFELLNAPLTHFKPREIDLSVEKARELGYTTDYQGRDLISEEQLCELFPQDIIVNEEAGTFFLGVTRFVDEELERFYGLKAHYNYNSKENLIGELFLGLAPHTSAAVVARLIGYTKARLNFAHPYFHLAKRRNCFPGDTQVLVEKNNETAMVKIGSLDNGENNELIPLEGLCTYTVLENGKIKKERVKALFKQKAPKKMWKIKTQFGREIVATPDHKLLIFEGGKIVKKKVEKLRSDDLLLSLHKFDIKKTIKEINVLGWYIKNTGPLEKRNLRVHNAGKKIRTIVKKNGGCWKLAKKIESTRTFKSDYAKGKWMHTAIDFDSIPLDLFEGILKTCNEKISAFKNTKIGYNKQKSTIPAIIKVNREIGELIGYYLADGWARTTHSSHAKKYVYQINFVSTEKEITNRLKHATKNVFGRKITIEKKGVDCITLNGHVYYDFFVKILGAGSKAKNKHVPQLFFNSCKESAQGLLGGFIVGDGHINANSIKTSSVNKEMLNEFAFLCNTLGLFPHVFREKRTINTGIVKEFYEKKGKTITLESWGFRLYSEDLLRAGKWLFGKKKKIFEKVRNAPLERRGKRIKKIGCFVLDKIKELKETKPKEEYVYDLVVEGNKTFIAGFGNIGVYDCDGDQDSIMLLMDALLNFSKQYLPSSRGGRMDAPLVFTIAINPEEIDDEVYEVETGYEYPLELYEKSLILSDPDLDSIPIIKKRIGKVTQYRNFGFTHHTNTFDEGPKASSYVTLKSMEEKMNAQAKIQNKIRALDKKDALERVMVSHFMPDIIGNARSFSKQEFRCTKCNAKYRRPPLTGKCYHCGEDKLILTIAQGSVRKYLEIAKKITQTYGLSNYLKQRLDLIEKEINSVFVNDKVQQKSLFEYV